MNRNPFRKTVGFYEVMTTSYTSGTKSEKSQNSVVNSVEKSTNMEPERVNTNSPRNVGFNLKDSHNERKKKYLTAKYGHHQMLLIKKRLGVEMWIFDELNKLYDSEDQDHDCDLELEEILNLDTDNERRQYAYEQLQDAKSKEEVNSFVEELIKKAKTL